MELTRKPVGSRDLRTLLGPLLELAAQSHNLIGFMAGIFRHGRRRYGLPRFLFVGPNTGQESIRLGLFAGVHGDEPAGCAALVHLLTTLVQQPEQATGYDLMVYPVCNPSGYESGTRANGRGRDLNREFWQSSTEPEVRLLEAELRAHRFDGIITLHADDTSEGLYGYAHGRTLNEALLRPALAASESVLLRNCRRVIDGFAASDGVICTCFPGVLSAPPEQFPNPFDLIFETPALAPLDLQVRAAVSALQTILDEYRGFIAQSQNI
jgi:hypothetical protein